MMTRTRTLSGMTLALVATHAASGQLVTFEMLDDASTAADMSPDGRFVVGLHDSGVAYIWTVEDGYTTLGGNWAVGVSDDGSVVLGTVEDPDTGEPEAAIWTDENGWVLLGPPPAGVACPSFTVPFELSADGTSAVGLAWGGGCDGRGLLWTVENGSVMLDSLANGVNRASAISGDGTLIGGFGQGSFARTPVIWTDAGAGQLLDPPNGDIVGEVFGISDDGNILLGTWDGKPFKWDQSIGIEIFNPVLGGWVGNAMDIADDDTIIGFDSFGLNRRAWIRPNGGPAVNLHAYLTGLGVTGMPVTLDVCMRISTNGNIIVGQNVFAGAWRVNLCAADCQSSPDGQVGINDFLALLAQWGQVGASCDVDGEGVGINDLLALLANWGSCL